MIELQSHYALDGLDLVHGIAALNPAVNRLLASATPSSLALTGSRVILYMLFLQGGLNGMRPTSKDGRCLIYIIII